MRQREREKGAGDWNGMVWTFETTKPIPVIHFFQQDHTPSYKATLFFPQTEDQAFKHVNLCGSFSFKPLHLPSNYFERQAVEL